MLKKKKMLLVVSAGKRRKMTIHGLAPPYISELISVRDTSGRYNLRSNEGILLNFPTCKSFITLGDRSFYMAAPKLWNDLPISIRNI